jgi:hypothetical protein
VKFLKMSLQFPLSNICKSTVRVIAFLLLRVTILQVTIESLFGVKSGRTLRPGAPNLRGRPNTLHHTLVWCSGGYCQGVWLNLSHRLRLRLRYIMVHRRGHGSMAQFWHYASADRVGPRQRSYLSRNDAVVAGFFE